MKRFCIDHHEGGCACTYTLDEAARTAADEDRNAAWVRAALDSLAVGADLHVAHDALGDYFVNVIKRSS